MGKKIYDFTAISLRGKEISMADYKGKVVGRYGSPTTPEKLDAIIEGLL